MIHTKYFWKWKYSLHLLHFAKPWILHWHHHKKQAGLSMCTCLSKSNYWLTFSLRASIMNLKIFFGLTTYNIYSWTQISSLPCFFTHWTPTLHYVTKLFFQTYISRLAGNLNKWKWKRLLCFSKEWTKDSHKHSLFSFH